MMRVVLTTEEARRVLEALQDGLDSLEYLHPQTQDGCVVDEAITKMKLAFDLLERLAADCSTRRTPMTGKAT